MSALLLIFRFAIELCTLSLINHLGRWTPLVNCDIFGFISGCKPKASWRSVRSLANEIEFSVCCLKCGHASNLVLLDWPGSLPRLLCRWPKCFEDFWFLFRTLFTRVGDRLLFLFSLSWCTLDASSSNLLLLNLDSLPLGNLLRTLWLSFLIFSPSRLFSLLFLRLGFTW